MSKLKEFSLNMAKCIFTNSLFISKISVCVCVCVCVRKRKRESVHVRERQTMQEKRRCAFEKYLSCRLV